jgi:hypothetical protein
MAEYCNQKPFSILHLFIPPHPRLLQLLVSSDLLSDKLHTTGGGGGGCANKLPQSLL